MSRRVWELAGCTTLAWLALPACGKIAGTPGNESGGASAATAGSVEGGSGAGGGSGSAGAAASTAGKQGASGGASGSSGGAPGSAGGAPGSAGGAPFGGTEDTRGGAPSTADAGASTGGDAGPPRGCNSRYLACGCGCCVGPTPLQRCVYQEVGPKTLDEIAGDDMALRNDSAGCAAAGCSLGIDYFACCEPPAQPEVATYEASAYIGDYDRLRLDKRGAVNCSAFALVRPKLGGEELPVELPTSWGIDQITRLPCISSTIGPRAIGAMGKLSLRVSDDACVVDAHLTAFFANAHGGVDAERFDAEGIPVNLSVAFCK